MKKGATIGIVATIIGGIGFFTRKYWLPSYAEIKIDSIDWLTGKVEYSMFLQGDQQGKYGYAVLGDNNYGNTVASGIDSYGHIFHESITTISEGRLFISIFKGFAPEDNTLLAEVVIDFPNQIVYYWKGGDKYLQLPSGRIAGMSYNALN